MNTQEKSPATNGKGSIKDFPKIQNKKKPQKTINVNIKKLPYQFYGKGEVKGFEFTQINKTDQVFFYEVHQGGIKPHYEVFRRKINKRFNCESYPTS